MPVPRGRWFADDHQPAGSGTHRGSCKASFSRRRRQGDQGLFYELTKKDVAEIVASHPDMLLLVGGTDGGNSECVLAMLKAFAGRTICPIVIAGNRNARMKRRALGQMGNPCLRECHAQI